MGVRDGLADPLDVGEESEAVRGRDTGGDALGEGAAADLAGGVVEGAVGADAELVDGDDARVVEARGGAGLEDEAGASDVVSLARLLQRDPSTEVAVEGGAHPAHPALAEHILADAVSSGSLLGDLGPVPTHGASAGVRRSARSQMRM